MPAAAHAQFTATPFSDPATGERYHIEASFGMVESVAGFRDRERVARRARHARSTPSTDLGIEQKRIRELRFVLRPGRKHKFRINYLPMSYSAVSTVHREFVFNGIRYNVNLPVTTELSWKTWHLGYEYDFLYRDRWFVGFVLQAKATDIQATLQAPHSAPSSRARRRPFRPSAASGASTSCRTSRSPASSTVFKIPDSIDERYQAHYFDFDLYGTVNFNDYVGAQIGYRSLDLGYVFEDDHGDFKAKGIYFGGVVRY